MSVRVSAEPLCGAAPELDDGQFVALLLELAEGLLWSTVDNFDSSLSHAQARVCRAMDISLSSIYRPGARWGGRLELTHVFSMGEGPDIPDSFVAADHFPWSEQQLLAGRRVVVDSVADLPPEAAVDQVSWRSFGIRATVVLALQGQDRQLLGTLSFGCKNRVGPWLPQTIWRLEAVGRMFAAALARNDQLVAQQEIEARYRQLSENALVGIFIIQDDRLAYVNDALARMFGYETTDLWGGDPFRLIHPSDAPRMRANMTARLAGEPAPPHYDFRGVRRDGSTMRMELYAVASAVDGRPAVLGNMIDVTARYEAQRLLADSERYFQLLAENSSDAVFHISDSGAIAWASSSICDFLGWQPDDVRGRVLADLAHPDDRVRAQAAGEQVRAGRSIQDQLRFQCADGSFRWVELAERPLREADGGGRVAALRDIQAIVEARELLEHVVGHDSLTGLASRARFGERMGEVISTATRSDQVYVVLAVGVDNLSAINAAYTHAAGDLVLATLARRIQDVVEPEGFVGRGPGAEFLVLVPDAFQGGSATRVAELILACAREPVEVNGRPLHTTFSIGIAAAAAAQADAEHLVREAKLAMHQAKADGRDCIRYFTPALAAQAERHLALLSDVRHALALGQFRAWYQPIANLSDGSLAGYEALVRWHAASGSLVRPGEFLPAIEGTPLIADIDLTVLRQAVTTLARVPEPLFLSVNVSPHTLELIDYAHELAELTTAAGVSPGRLHVEITETTLLHTNAVINRAINAVAATGARWFVDDFGTGYSSISHLRDLPLAGLKLDTSFTAGIRRGEPTSLRVSEALAGLARGLGVDTVAEGIEAEHEAAILASQGWRHGQGWHFGRPRAQPGIPSGAPK